MAEENHGSPHAERNPLAHHMSDDELREFVIDYCDGTVTTSAEVPSDLLTFVFMPLMFGMVSGVPKEEIEAVGCIWASTRKHETMSRMVNEFPIFASCAVMDKPSWERARKAIEAELARRKNIPV